MRRKIQFIAEYALVRALMGVISLLPARAASNIGGWLGRMIGPYVKRSKLALKQMETHLPESTPEERARYLREMWDNLGRVLFEYPHLAAGRMNGWVEMHGLEHLEAAKAHGKPIMCISGHIGSWEMAPNAMAMAGLKLHLIYRPPNNPYLDRWIDSTRAHYTLGHYGKGSAGAKGSLKAVRAGESLGMLIDQKDNAGAPIRFLQSDAMTMISGAKLALKSEMIVLPMRTRRVNGTHFRMEISPAITLPAADAHPDSTARELALTQKMTDIMADFVRDTPGQWFWVHRRWPKA